MNNFSSSDTEVIMIPSPDIYTSGSQPLPSIWPFCFLFLPFKRKLRIVDWNIPVPSHNAKYVL